MENRVETGVVAQTRRGGRESTGVTLAEGVFASGGWRARGFCPNLPVHWAIERSRHCRRSSGFFGMVPEDLLLGREQAC
jgi:hypothetical protein